jgi:hypothetical protein
VYDLTINMHTFKIEGDFARHKNTVFTPGTLIVCDAGIYVYHGDVWNDLVHVEHAIEVLGDEKLAFILGASEMYVQALFDDGCIRLIHESDLHFIRVQKT